MRPPETITPPSSHADYNAVLRKGLGSKLFFMDKVPLSEMGLVVDFGCGDASLLRVVANAVPEDCLLVGVDSDHKQLEMARKNFVGIDEAFLSMEPVRFYLSSNERPSLLVLSSVVHEVLSPGTTWSPEGFWGWVAGFGFDYIAFRDMSPQWSLWAGWELAERSHSFKNHSPALLASFEERWGSIKGRPDTFLHYLLKEPYVDDWARENAEDYWAGTRMIPQEVLVPAGYQTTHWWPTITQHFRERVLKVHGFELPPGITTHLELVLKKWTPSSPS